MASIDRTSIQAALMGLVKEGEFFPVIYDRNTKLPQVDFGSPVAVSSFHVNEVRAEFSNARDRRTARHRRRSTWVFELILGFDREVALEKFEQVLLDDPPVVDTETIGRVTLFIRNADYTHPPMQGGSTGTSVRYEIGALSPLV